MQRLGGKLAEKLRDRFEGKSLNERMDELVLIMTDLGFQVKVGTEPEPEPETDKPNIKACNCIYHDLAQKHNEICEFDLALMSSLLNKEVEQLSCMAKGDCDCSFRIKEK
jgi:predicted ArsR family transcriptional regulator